jgi:hypothetical protein
MILDVYIFRAEAAQTVVYILNRSFTNVLKDITPYEALFAAKPNISNLKIFGSNCIFKVHDVLRKKLVAKEFFLDTKEIHFSEFLLYVAYFLRNLE